MLEAPPFTHLDSKERAGNSKTGTPGGTRGLRGFRRQVPLELGPNLDSRSEPGSCLELKQDGENERQSECDREGVGDDKTRPAGEKKIR